MTRPKAPARLARTRPVTTRLVVAETPHALLMDGEALIQQVAADLDIRAPLADQAVRTVYGVLRQAISAGELADFEARIPQDAARLLKSR